MFPSDISFLSRNNIDVVKCDNISKSSTTLSHGSSGTTTIGTRYDPVILARCLLDTQATYALKLQQSKRSRKSIYTLQY